MKLKLSLILFFLSIPLVTSRAAEKDTLSPFYLVSFHPLQIYGNGIKFEFERRLPNSHVSLSVSPEFYFGRIDGAKDNLLLGANRDTVEVLGFGICAAARAYASNNPRRGDMENPVSNFYLYGSLEFRSFGLDYTGKSWTLEHENGIDIYRLKSTKLHNSILRINSNIGIGNTIFFGNEFFIDLFVYARVCKAFENPSSLENVPYTDGFFTMTGNSLGMGFRFGLMFN